MIKLNKRSIQIIKSLFVLFLVISWLLTGYPAIWVTPKSQFPPKILEVRAATPTRVQQPTCSNNGATTIACTLTSAPVNGNALIAVIGTRGTAIGQVTSITQTGATWVKAVEVASSSDTSEIWYALNVSGASTSVTVNLAASLKASAIISEYSGLLTASALDVTASSTGSSTSPVTGTTATTAQANELWVGGLNAVGTVTYSTPTNSFSLVANAQSTGGAGSTKNSAEYLERMVTTTGTANTGATISSSAAWAGVIATFKGQSTTTLATGTDPASATIAPGSAITDADAFTLATDFGTDSVTALTVTLAGSGTPYQGLAEVRITSDNGATLYFAAVTTFTSNTVNFSGGTAIPITTTSTQFKIRITPLSHANMPVPPGALYALSPIVSSMTTTNTQAGSDTMVNTITIDNLSPNGATLTSGTAGNAAVTLNWTTSNSADFATTNGSVVLRWAAASAGTEVPAEGNTSYVAGNTIGTSTVACVISSAASTALSKIDGTGGSAGCTTAALTNGQAYTYKVFQVDTYGNYDVGVLIGTFTPAAASPTYTQNHYRWYVDAASENVTDPWSATAGIDIAEDTAIPPLPFAYDPPGPTETLRLRTNITVNTATITGNSKYFKLQYRTGIDSDCSTGTWTDVGTGDWLYNTSSSVVNGTALTIAKLTATNILETYSKAKPATTPNGTSSLGQNIEFDFNIVGTNSTSATRYLFRVVETDSVGTASTNLAFWTNCPILTSKPGTANFMRHGNFFSGGSDQGFFWAN